MLADPVLEARAREVTRQLRCPVCEGQDIDDSGAQLAADLRRIVREKLAAGMGEEEIFDWLAARYGEGILMNPPLKARTLLLWAAPWLVFIGGAAFLLRRRAR